MMTGEYFLSEKAKDMQKHEKKRVEKESKKQEKVEKKLKQFEAPDEVQEQQARKALKEEVRGKKHDDSKKPDIEDLKKKFLKKK